MPRGRHRTKRRRAPSAKLAWLAAFVLVAIAVARCAPRWTAPSAGGASRPGATALPGAPSPRGAGAPAPAGLGEVETSRHVALGVPLDGDPSDDYLLDERVYVASYNAGKGVPNWVSWNLNRSHLGRVRRRDDFRANPHLPAAFRAVTPQDYAHSGFDRGHLCPSADRDAAPEDNSLTFLMTNMVPQLHELNAGPWEELERHARELASRPGTELYIVAGGIFAPPARFIGRGVAVPSASWKIVVALRDGESARDVTADTPAIAVVMPNAPGVGAHRWTEFVTSIDAIEAATGYDFLPRVAEETQRALEARVATR